MREMAEIASLIAKIHSIGNEYCKSQMYSWPGFDPMEPNPKKFFRKLGIKFDGDLFIRYPVKRTFRPMPVERIEAEEREIEVALPGDYKSLLAEFGDVHLPGDAGIAIATPLKALKMTRGAWCSEAEPLSILAVSPFNRNSDGNCLGFIRKGSEFMPEVYEFRHELLYHGDDPALWSKLIADSLSDFLFDYLQTHDRRNRRWSRVADWLFRK